jgi:hypothetical protein
VSGDVEAFADKERDVLTATTGDRRETTTRKVRHFRRVHQIQASGLLTSLIKCDNEP